MSEKLTDEVLELLERGRDMTLASLLPDGGPHAVVVSYASRGLSLYFGCDPTSQKAVNIAGDPRVAITITSPYSDWSQIRGLAISGRATRLHGQAAEVAAESFMKKFDEIAQYITTGAEIALFQIMIERVSLLDYRRGFGHLAYGRASSRQDGRLTWDDAAGSA
ncbi:pyridoxamine 5'-phosphate oxidase family protein [Phenylobacterium sp. LjRoot164]|uniref:pyridoxamine 5'-phosphate oxidase family protein n=1 Tax=unclassified Phenylobacterium TaxID=2640670 RepID=UPI003ED16EC9